MEWLLKNVNNAPKEIAESTNPKLRLFTVKKATSYEPVPDIAGANGWNAILRTAEILLQLLIFSAENWLRIWMFQSDSLQFMGRYQYSDLDQLG
jgi:hypothetical protein